jgi:HSP20 family protein
VGLELVPADQGLTALVRVAIRPYVDRGGDRLVEEVCPMIEIWDEIATTQRRIDELVREYLGPRARPSYPAFPLFVRRPFLPVTDVFVRDDDVVVRLELPGIRGERRRDEEVKEEDYYRMEAAYGTFERRFPIPEGVGEEKIVAEYSDGILEITLPKVAKVLESPKAKEIPVKPVKSLRETKAA